jgi:type IV secretory pathway VirB9-like protein
MSPLQRANSNRRIYSAKVVLDTKSAYAGRHHLHCVFNLNKTAPVNIAREVLQKPTGTEANRNRYKVSESKMAGEIKPNIIYDVVGKGVFVEFNGRSHYLEGPFPNKKKAEEAVMLFCSEDRERQDH